MLPHAACMDGRLRAAASWERLQPSIAVLRHHIISRMAARAAAASVASHMVAKSVLGARSACTAPPGGLRPALLCHAAGTALLQGPQYHRRQAAAAGKPSQQRRLVAVSVAAPAAAGPHASPMYGGEMQAAVEAVRLASRLCQVRCLSVALPGLPPFCLSIFRLAAGSEACWQAAGMHAHQGYRHCHAAACRRYRCSCSGARRLRRTTRARSLWQTMAHRCGFVHAAFQWCFRQAYGF